jgi:hypothetical protein
MDQLRARFEKHARIGITLSARQLADFALKKGIKIEMSELRKIRHEFKFTAFASRYQKPLKYMSNSVGRYGKIQRIWQVGPSPPPPPQVSFLPTWPTT